MSQERIDPETGAILPTEVEELQARVLRLERIILALAKGAMIHPHVFTDEENNAHDELMIDLAEDLARRGS